MNMIWLILFGVLLNASAQLLLKEGMHKIGYFAFSWHNIRPIALQVAFNPYIAAGLACYVFSVVVWLMVLSRVEVSYAYPLVSLGYVVTAIAAYFLMHEQISLVRMLGILVIISGVYLVTRT